MKLSVNKILYHWYGKVNPDYKYHELQMSFMPNFGMDIDLCVSLRRSFGNLNLINIFILGIFSLRVWHTRDEDHAGLYFSMNILGLDIDYSYKDVRHYDHDNEKWEECDIEEINKNYYTNR